MKFFRNSKKGFTLIELLVVVAIIGLLASIVLASLTSAEAKARDAQRAEDVHSLKTAIELYYNDNGFYPYGPSGDNLGSWMSALATPLAPYIGQIPDDPLGGNYAWQYVRGPDKSSYGLWIYYEKTGARCGTGINFNPGWWGIGGNMCPF